MTTAEIQKQLAKAGKTVGLTQLYKYFDRLGIFPVGNRRQRPQQYPAYAPRLILSDLGFSVSDAENGQSALANGKHGGGKISAAAASGSVQTGSKNHTTASPRRAADALRGKVRGTSELHTLVQRGATPRPATKVLTMKQLNRERKKNDY